MARRTSGERRAGIVKARTRVSLVLRFAGRVAASLVAFLVLSLIAAQFVRVIGQNVALARELSSTQSEVAVLRARAARQMRDIRRLQDPSGAVPEIHDRLRLVRPNETLIFVSPAPPSTAPDSSR